MKWLRFSLAVVVTSAALVAVLFGAGALVVGNALASGIPGAQHGMNFGPGGPAVPAELASLKDVPAAERFAHFKGVQANLTDKEGKPITINVTPGVANAVSPNSLTIAANDGTSHTFALNDQTMTRGKTVTNGQDVVVVTIDNTSAARAVIGVDPAGWSQNNWSHN